MTPEPGESQILKPRNLKVLEILNMENMNPSKSEFSNPLSLLKNKTLKTILCHCSNPYPEAFLSLDFINSSTPGALFWCVIYLSYLSYMTVSSKTMGVAYVQISDEGYEQGNQKPQMRVTTCG